MVTTATRDVDTRISFLKRYGSFSLAYSTAVQPMLEHLVTPQGYIAYARRGRRVFVLGDPVADTADYPDLLGQFVDTFPDATFVQTGAATAAVLEQRGYYVNDMGVDSTLQLPDFSFDGKQREWLRYSSNWIRNRGYRIVETPISQMPLAEIAEVSTQWRQTRPIKRREVWFVNRPLVLADEPDVRYFFLVDPDGCIVAFTFFDPMYREGVITGYCTSIKRRLPEAPSYGEPALMRHAIQQFREEGIAHLSLGLSPLAGIRNDRFRHNPFLHVSFRYFFRAWWVNRFFYNLRGHAHYKRRYGGTESPTYYASPVYFNDPRIWSLLRMVGML